MQVPGEKFGRLLLVTRTKIKRRTAWECLCDCGNKTTVLQQSLRSKMTQSCGCFQKECITDNLSGQKFGYWTVLTADKKRAADGGLYWLCQCDCGENRSVSASTLKLGTSISCGCSMRRPVCPYGHDTLLWGRDATGMCRACIKNRNLKREYGITLAEFFHLYDAQEGKCCICKKGLGDPRPGNPGFGNGSRIEVDHEHGTNRPKKETVRGLLCGGRWAGCNRKLGRLDKVDWLAAALEYVKNPPAKVFLDKTTSSVV